MEYERYEVGWSETWNAWFVEDTFTGAEVGSFSAHKDAETIAECLNVIGYDRE